MIKKTGVVLSLAVLLGVNTIYVPPAHALDWGKFGTRIIKSIGDTFSGGHSSKPKVVKKDKYKETHSETTILDNRMYQIVDIQGGYKKAKLYAERVGGHLAVIDSPRENQLLYNFMVSQGYDSAYIGLIDENLDGNWKLYNGEQPKFLNWHSGQPTREEKNEKYAMLYRKYKNGKWKAGSFSPLLENSNSTAFIIEWDKEVHAADYKEPVKDNTPVYTGEPSYDSGIYDDYQDNSNEEEISG